MGLRAFRLVGSLRGLVGVLLAGVAMGGAASVLPQAAVAAGACPNEGLRAEDNSLGLPDCRAYEMVTPVDKNSALVSPVERPTVAADGSSLVGGSPEGFAGIGNDELQALTDAYYRFTRTGSGWVTIPLNPYRGRLASIGMGDSVWEPAEPQSIARLRLRGADGSLSEIGPVWPSALGQNQNLSSFFVLGAAAEASHGVVFVINERGLLWPFDKTLSGSSLYGYTGTRNTVPSLVGVSGGPGSSALIGQCGTTLGAFGFADDGEGQGEYNAVSEDGSRVFFTVAGTDSNACGGVEPAANELFARIEGSQTVAISEPSKADCPLCDTSAPMDAVFKGASADGSKVFFTTSQPLLGSDTSRNLYEYDFDPPAGEPKVVRVSGGDGSVAEPTAEVLGVTRISEDGSHVYFVAKGVLTNGLNSQGEGALAGTNNLYLFERDAQYPAGRTVFIADLGAGDMELWGVGNSSGDVNRPAQATPDGRFLLFTSFGDLTAGDTSTARQMFQYDAQAGSLVRVSIGQEGFDDNGNAGGAGASIAIQDYVAGARGGAIARSMSDDGSYVFFQSQAGLTPLASSGAENVYEYHAGRVSLIAAEGELIGTSASGGDVFFRTANQLVPQDTDTQWDFYDARVDGGFPTPVTATGCVGDACQGPPAAPLLFGSPSSVVFSGAGNVTPPVSRPAVKPRALTVAQQLSRALKACLKGPRRKRASCETRARKRHGHTSTAVKSDRRSK